MSGYKREINSSDTVYLVLCIYLSYYQGLTRRDSSVPYRNNDIIK